MKKLFLLFLSVLLLTGCSAGSGKKTVNAEDYYGTISIQIPSTWEADTSNDHLKHGKFGFTLTPKDAENGSVELSYVPSFGACANERTVQHSVIAGYPATIVSYGSRWDYISFDDSARPLMAFTNDCRNWSDRTWQEAMDILNSMTFEKARAIHGYGTDSAQAEVIGLTMSVNKVTSSGLMVRFVQNRDLGDVKLSYGEEFTLEKQSTAGWVEMRPLTKDAAFTQEAFLIPFESDFNLEIDWKRFYGELPPGKYRLCKTVWATCQTFEGITTEQYPMKVEFLLY